MAWWQCWSTHLISNLRTRELVQTIVILINICHRRRIQQRFSLLIGRFLPGSPSLPPPQRLPLLSLSRLNSQAVPRGTKVRTCTPNPYSLRRGLRIIYPDQTRDPTLAFPLGNYALYSQITITLLLHLMSFQFKNRLTITQLSVVPPFGSGGPQLVNVEDNGTPLCTHM